MNLPSAQFEIILRKIERVRDVAVEEIVEMLPNCNKGYIKYLKSFF